MTPFGSLPLLMKRFLAFAVVATLLGGLMAGCSQPPEGDTSVPDKSTPADGGTDTKAGETTK